MKKVVEVKQLGRPVNENSARQLRLKELELKRSNGELKRGRPVVENSERQLRLAKQAINKANGIGQGRPINLNSARQIRLAELQAKRDLGICFRGRPKQIKGDELAA
jgi:exonuclease VII small subunit